MIRRRNMVPSPACAGEGQGEGPTARSASRTPVSHLPSPISALRVLAFASTLVATGCAVGPNYTPPEVETPSAYRAEVSGADAASIAELAWWNLFSDDTLKTLIEEALENNQDLLIASARVEQARWVVGSTRADLVPQIGYDGSAARRKIPNPTGDNPTNNAFLGAFQMAWEIDVWGRIRRATEASMAGLLGAEDVRRAVILSVVSEVAQAYFDLRELDTELEIARRTRDSFAGTLKLFSAQLRGGVGNRLAVVRAEAALADAAAAIPELERQIVVKENQLSVLLGRSPGEITRGLGLTEQPIPPQTPSGLPASLLERRPDILAAEQDIVAANALVGVTIANFLPRIGLTTLYGGQSSELENVVKGSGNVWSVAGSLTGPIFQGGQLYSDYKGQLAVWEESKTAYDRTVLNALREVSNAIVSRQKFAETRTVLEGQVESLREAVRLALMRFDGGLASYFEVLEAQQQLFPAENQLARTQLNQLNSAVQLYRALGGGWRAEEERNPERYPQRRDVFDRIIPAVDRTTEKEG